MTLEDRVDTLERRVTRYRGATMVMALVLVAGVTMGQATTDGEFSTVTCRTLIVNGTMWANSREGKQILVLGESANGNGSVSIYSPEGKNLVMLGGDARADGKVLVYRSDGKSSVVLGTVNGDGNVAIRKKSGKVKFLK
jgi:hypothetical protein